MINKYLYYHGIDSYNFVTLHGKNPYGVIKVPHAIMLYLMLYFLL